MDIDDVLKEINEASMEIPFENSIFQTENFMIKGAILPTRAYRAILLRMNSRIQALNEAKYSLAKEDIDIEELEYDMEIENKSLQPNTFYLRRTALEIAKKKESRAYTMKLVHDAIVEVNYLYSAFKKFPKYTREQFESQERDYFLLSLNRQAAGLSGAPSSLLDMDALPNCPTELTNNKAITEILLKTPELIEVTMKQIS